jgi:hypothetical protein
MQWVGACEFVCAHAVSDVSDLTDHQASFASDELARAPIRLALGLTNPEVLCEIGLVESLERASPDKIRAFQQNRLERLLHHAWRHTDYYRTNRKGKMACWYGSDGRVLICGSCR